MMSVLAAADPKIDATEPQQGPEFDAALAAFEARIQRGDKIEPHDWMPLEYRKQLIRMISQHAHSEIVGCLPEGGWIPNAPTFRRKLALTAKVQDEAGHGQLLYRAAETLGITREQMLDDLLSGKAKYANVFNYPAQTWADVGMIGWLVDAAAIVNQLMLAEGSYGPYARAMKRICYEESFHLKQGHHFVVTMAGGTRQQRSMVQAALDRWWWPTLMMFGPNDKDSVHLEKMRRWKVKTKSNDELRYDFVAQYAPQILRLGLIIPDPELRYDEAAKRWHFGEPNWEEFKRVIGGHGPLNAERLAVRRAAHEEGRWVREALASVVVQ
ncbi:MAG: 1,2-phenylacetyl-CoA epoxidase subunit A [Thermoflexales bacterium]|nr:1,2-phenylacetyl-CoA epoxidase subunit A [Thermoflexales bacterium]